MKKGKIVKKLIRKYSIKHGDLIDINTLKYISGKEKIEVDDLMTILRISVSSRYRIRQNPFNKARIKIFDTEELKEIEVSIKDEVKDKERITAKCLEKLCNKYRINIKILNKILKISKDQTYKLKKGQKHIILKQQSEEKTILNDLFVEEIKYNNFINRDLIEYLKRKYKINDEEIYSLLKVKKENYKNLMQKKTQNMKIDLIDEYEKREIEQKLIERFKIQDFITKEEIINIKEEIKTTNTILMDILSISRESFSRLMNNQTKKTRIIIKETKLKMNYLKMDIKYEYGERFYTSSELRKLCRRYKIKFDDFLKNLSTNVNRYPYIKQALRQNKQGIYIGEEHQISEKFAEEYAKRIENLCRRITNRYCYSTFLYTEKQDIMQEAFILILQKGGNIEKNFNYDEDLLFNLFASKVKYFVIGKRNQRYKEILLDSFEKYSGNYDEYNIFDESSSCVNTFDSRIKLIHQNIMQIFKDNKDYIFNNRKNAYKIIANKFKITIEKLEIIIQEIKDIYIEYGFAKKCIDGRVIDMSDVYDF